MTATLVRVLPDVDSQSGTLGEAIALANSAGDERRSTVNLLRGGRDVLHGIKGIVEALVDGGVCGKGSDTQDEGSSKSEELHDVEELFLY